MTWVGTASEVRLVRTLTTEATRVTAAATRYRSGAVEHGCNGHGDLFEVHVLTFLALLGACLVGFLALQALSVEVFFFFFVVDGQLVPFADE